MKQLEIFPVLGYNIAIDKKVITEALNNVQEFLKTLVVRNENSIFQNSNSYFKQKIAFKAHSGREYYKNIILILI